MKNKQTRPNEITRADAGGPRCLLMPEPWAARAAQFCRSAFCAA